MSDNSERLVAAVSVNSKVIELEAHLVTAQKMIFRLREQRDEAREINDEYGERIGRIFVAISNYKEAPFLTRLFGVGDLLDKIVEEMFT